jgi:hypothetical protein
MTLAIFILAWLLVNTWLTLIICIADGDMLSEWDELGLIALCAIVCPITLLTIKAIIYKIKKYKVIKKKYKSNLKIKYKENN